MKKGIPDKSSYSRHSYNTPCNDVISLVAPNEGIPVLAATMSSALELQMEVFRSLPPTHKWKQMQTTTDIKGRSQTLILDIPTTPHAMMSSALELQMKVFRSLLQRCHQPWSSKWRYSGPCHPHTSGNKCKQPQI